MTREEKYVEQLKQLGIYQPAFEPAIHTLAMMEREVQRMVKDWKAAGSPVGTKLHNAIVTQRRDILARQDALGLTPKGLHRLQSKSAASENPETPGTTVLELVRERKRDGA